MDHRAILNRYHLKESEYGITTGSAATAAALAALLSIKGKVEEVEIKTPLGEIILDVKHSERLNSYSGRASVVKYPYNDPDVTKNIEIIAELILKEEPEIVVKGGEGVGKVTKPGLQVPVGKYAINPTPMDMIVSNLRACLPEDKGAEVIITIPKGRELAKKTLNSRLGVVDGISILGTTGFARSMNLKSYKASYRCQIDVAVAEGYDYLVFVPGNIGEKIARDLLDIEDDQVVQMGNFVGYMLEQASKEGVKKITLLGHAGKLIKISAGIFNTKHSVADGRREIITSHTAISGANRDIIGEIFKSNTTEDMISILKNNGLIKSVFNSIANEINLVCTNKYNMDFEVIIVNMEGEVLNDAPFTQSKIRL